MLTIQSRISRNTIREHH